MDSATFIFDNYPNLDELEQKLVQTQQKLGQTQQKLGNTQQKLDKLQKLGNTQQKHQQKPNKLQRQLQELKASEIAFQAKIQTWHDQVENSCPRWKEFLQFVTNIWGRYHCLLLLGYGCGNAPISIQAAMRIARNNLFIPCALVVQSVGGGAETDAYSVGVPSYLAVSLRDCTIPAAYSKMAIMVSQELSTCRSPLPAYGVGSIDSVYSIWKKLYSCVRGEYTTDYDLLVYDY